MFPAVIISGGQVDLAPDPDLLVLNRGNIADVRAAQKFLQRRPYRKAEKTVVFAAAGKLTLPAQQALLKTLEEPPAHSQIILLCDNPYQLLPTIVSRCLIKRSPEAETQTGQLQKPSVEAYTNADAAKKFVLNQLHDCREQLRLHPATANIKLIKALNRALNALNANVNPKLTLDVLSLYY